MLESHQEKEMTRAEALKKADAWRTINQCLVQANSKFMNNLHKLLSDKQALHEELKLKLEKGDASEEDNGNFIFIGGYIQCLKDILNAKS